tara:strand:- start:88 stop:303 length:216 start_codon:yes stop_codon:yes gene_type:complete
MPTVFRPIMNAESEYSYENEKIFRRDLEGYLLKISADIGEVMTLRGKDASLASKRERFLAPAIGVVTVDGV